MVIDKKRKPNFRTFKIKNRKIYELHLFCEDHNGYKQWWNIPLEHGGKLATSVGNVFFNGEPIRRYEVSFAKLPDKVKEQVRVAVKYIEDNGTPIENDESIFGPDYGK